MKPRTRKVILGLASALLLWVSYTAISIWNYGNEDHAVKSDCIIVLGAATSGANPSPVFEERIRHAITLFKDGKASTIIFTGGFGDGASHSESEVGSAYAINEGVPTSAILTESESRTTHQNFVYAKILMDAADLKTAIIVSDPLHLKRASVMAVDLDIPAVTSPTPTSRYRSLRAKFGFLSREVIFLSYHKLTGK